LASGTTEAFNRTLDQRINRPQAVIDSDAFALFKQCLLVNKKRKVVIKHYSPDEVYENMNRKGALGVMSNATGKIGEWYECLTDNDKEKAAAFDQKWEADNGYGKRYWTLANKCERRVRKPGGPLFPYPRAVTFMDERRRFTAMSMFLPIYAEHNKSSLFWGSNIGRPLWKVGNHLAAERTRLEELNGVPYVYVTADVKWWDTSIEPPLIEYMGSVWADYTDVPLEMQRYARELCECTVITVDGRVYVRRGEINSGDPTTSLWNGDMNSEAHWTCSVQ
jgi:hypothetical protein